MFRLVPPELTSIETLITELSFHVLAWISEKHVEYLDNRIYKIDALTDYLSSCDMVKTEREEFISFVLNWTLQDSANLEKYVEEYAKRFHQVRYRVEVLCDRVMSDNLLWQSPTELKNFWRDFTYINEIDNLHGMFLTSGRWYVNVMLPVFKELVYCTLPNDVEQSDKNLLSYYTARHIITPRYVDLPAGYNSIHERRFIRIIAPLLKYYDEKLLFLFNMMSNIPINNLKTIKEFVMDVTQNSQRYIKYLQMGIYPPFAWHELHASRNHAVPSIEYDDAVQIFMQNVMPENSSRAKIALHTLDIFKEYELNYNNYNYKGRFGIVSKYQYWKTIEFMKENTREGFLDAILLDEFYNALDIVENGLDSI